MKYLSIFILMMITLSSCSDNKPEELINKDKMTQILIEMHIAEAKVNTLGLSSDSTDVLINLMTERVLNQLGYTEEEYLTSYNYYMRDVRQMEQLYSRVVDSLSLREEISSNTYK
jgi:hypothetical protein